MIDINNWLWPQWTVIVLWGVGLLLEAAVHGKKKTGNFNILTGIIRTGLSFWIFYAGGFFK